MCGADRRERKALGTLHARMGADVQLASPERGWDTIAVSRARLGRLQVDLPPLDVATFGINYGPLVHLGRSRTRATHCKPGHIVIVPMDRPTQWLCDRVCDVVMVCLSRGALEAAAAATLRRDPRSIEIVPRFAVRDLVLERVTHHLLREVVRPEAGARMRVQAWTQEIATQLVQAHSNLGRPRDRKTHTIPPHKLKRVKDYMCANLARDLSLEDVAKAADMSKFHFAKAFRQATGTAPHRYLIEHRILRGRTLLHDRSLSIHAIAREMGFTHSHFTRLFTRHMGMTPTAFRELL